MNNYIYSDSNKKNEYIESLKNQISEMTGQIDDYKNEVYHYKKHTDLIKRPDGITFPITTDDIPRYEELNNIQINVFFVCLI